MIAILAQTTYNSQCFVYYDATKIEYETRKPELRTNGDGSNHEALSAYAHVDQVHWHFCVPPTFHFHKSVPHDGKAADQSCKEQQQQKSHQCTWMIY